MGYSLIGSGSVHGQVAGACNCGDELLGSIKSGEFFDYLRNC
jgi:hypothetical protein